MRPRTVNHWRIHVYRQTEDKVGDMRPYKVNDRLIYYNTSTYKGSSLEERCPALTVLRTGLQRER